MSIKASKPVADAHGNISGHGKVEILEIPGTVITYSEDVADESTGETDDVLLLLASVFAFIVALITWFMLG